MREGAKITLFFVSIILGLALIMFVAVAIDKRVSFPAQEAKIEQLRVDAANIDQNSEDVVGQITQTNQNIRSMQAWNSVPVIGWVYPDAWDEIELIELPASSR